MRRRAARTRQPQIRSMSERSETRRRPRWQFLSALKLLCSATSSNRRSLGSSFGDGRHACGRNKTLTSVISGQCPSPAASPMQSRIYMNTSHPEPRHSHGEFAARPALLPPCDCPSPLFESHHLTTKTWQHCLVRRHSSSVSDSLLPTHGALRQFHALVFLTAMSSDMSRVQTSGTLCKTDGRHIRR